MASEFELINFLFEPLSSGLSTTELGIGDDGAVLDVPENHQLVVVTDTLVSGVHFPKNTLAYDIAWKSVAVNLSDLAAMGATPGFYSLALTIPNNSQMWLDSFARGLGDICSSYDIPLIGGDTTNGPLTVTVTAQGWVPNGQAVKRSGAQAGDVICVTNYIGNGALGLMVALGSLPKEVEAFISDSDKQYLLDALNLPQAQVEFGSEMKKFANSAVDISDGLLADLGHILEASNKVCEVNKPLLGAALSVESVPLSNVAKAYIEKTGNWQTILAGGDDYQLCFTLPRDKFELAQEMAIKHGVKVAQIGEIIELNKTRLHGVSLSKSDITQVSLMKAGQIFDIGEETGYMHF